jgi:hypothetical protein
LPEYEDPIPEMNEGGIPPSFDFIGLGQPGVHHLNHDDQVENEDPLPDDNNMFHEQIPDLNLDVFDGLQDPEDFQNDLDNGMEIIPLGPKSVELNSFMQDMVSSGSSVNQESDDNQAKIVLALPVEPTNFLPLEIGPEELMDDASQEAQEDDQMVQSQAPQAHHRDASVTLPQLPQSHQQDAQNIS